MQPHKDKLSVPFVLLTSHILYYQYSRPLPVSPKPISAFFPYTQQMTFLAPVYRTWELLERNSLNVLVNNLFS